MLQRLLDLISTEHLPTSELAQKTLQTAMSLTQSTEGFLAQYGLDSVDLPDIIYETSTPHPCSPSDINILCRRFTDRFINTDTILIDNHVVTTDTMEPSFSRYLIIPLLQNEQIASILCVANSPAAYTESDGDLIHLTVGPLLSRLIQQDIPHMRHISEKQKDNAADARTNFLANLSHELRTPMNAIIGMTYLLSQTSLSEQQRDYLKKMNRASSTLLELLNSVLDISKLDAGQLDLEIIDFNLQDTMMSIANFIGAKGREKGLEILFDMEPDVPLLVKGDPLRLTQILLNLVSNAVKFTSQGEISVTAHVVSRKDNRIALGFAVRDTGVGMKPDQIETLFLPFTQADASTTRKYGGTGLGLSIAKGLVEKMGGHLRVHSELNVGSSFFFTAHFGISDQSSRNASSPYSTFQQRRILIVDDNPMVLRAINRLLSRLGCQVDQVNSGEKAMERLQSASRQSRRYDLILLDWMMPGLNGGETTRRIKTDPTIHPAPAIIIMSGLNDEEELRKQAKASGADGYLTKPLTPSAILDGLMDTLHGQRNPINQSDLNNGVTAPAAIRKSRILIVEDNKTNQQVAKEILVGAGFQVSVADDGEQALKLLQNSPFRVDAILMDIHMPHMDGCQTTREIRKDIRFAELPIIAMTAKVTSKDREEALRSGMNDHIPKPFDPTELFATLAKWVPESNVRNRSIIPSLQSPEENLLRTKLPNFALDDALSRVAGQVDIYQKMIFAFADRHQSTISSLEQALSEHDPGIAVEIVHNLKGVSGNLGITEVYKQATALESALTYRSEDAPHFRGIEPLRQALCNALSCIETLRRQIVPVQNLKCAKNISCMTDALPYLRQLESLLQNSEATSVTYFLSFASRLEVSEIDPILESLTAAITGYEFESASKTLSSILSTETNPHQQR